MAGKGLMKEMKCSEELAAVIKADKISRGQMMKRVWVYIKKHGLQGAKDDKGKMSNRWIAPDEKLGAVLGNKPLSMFKMAGKLSKHLS
jgi:DNA topoisomerase I